MIPSPALGFLGGACGCFGLGGMLRDRFEGCAGAGAGSDSDSVSSTGRFGETFFLAWGIGGAVTG